MRSMLALIGMALLVAGCASRPDAYESSRTSSARPEFAGCSFQDGYADESGTEVPAGYYCLVPETYSASVSGRRPWEFTTERRAPSGCSFVQGYTRSDGRRVGPFVRCESMEAAAAFKGVSVPVVPAGAIAGEPQADCVTQVCGPVSVRGYTRKDGTYVRPYTRKR